MLFNMDTHVEIDTSLSARQSGNIAAVSSSATPAATSQLSAEQLDRVIEFLKSKDGICSLGQLSAQCTGIKVGLLKAAGFVFSEPNAHGQKQIGLPGSIQPPPPEYAPKKRNGPVPAPQKLSSPTTNLSPEHIEVISRYIQEKGGVCPLGELSSQFMGIKVASMQAAGFSLSEPGAHGQRQIAVPGSSIPDPPSLTTTVDADARAEAKVCSSTKVLSCEQVEQITQYLQSQGGVCTLGHLASQQVGIKVGSLQRAGFVLSEPNAHGQMRIALPVSARPDPPEHVEKGEVRSQAKSKKAVPAIVLTAEQVEEITQFLQSKGGMCPLGELASHRVGIKMNSLQGSGFVFSEPNAHGQKQIAPPGSSTPDPPEHVRKEAAGTHPKPQVKPASVIGTA